MNRKKLFRGMNALAVALAGFVFVAAMVRLKSNESSQMQDLANLADLKKQFEQDSGKVRLIALVSPICPECRRGFADMQLVLKENPDTRLRAYIVWLPMFPGDSRSWAQTRANEFNDDRLTYYWDGNRLSGGEWGNTLGINRTAWDVYFLFGSASQWGQTAPTPSYWMHQLGGVTNGPYLNKEEFGKKVKELLAATK